jgi:hypothetical protein
LARDAGAARNVLEGDRGTLALELAQGVLGTIESAAVALLGGLGEWFSGHLPLAMRSGRRSHG